MTESKRIALRIISDAEHGKGSMVDLIAAAIDEMRELQRAEDVRVAEDIRRKFYVSAEKPSVDPDIAEILNARGQGAEAAAYAIHRRGIK